MKVTQVYLAPFLTDSKQWLASTWAPTLGLRALPVLVFSYFGVRTPSFSDGEVTLLAIRGTPDAHYHHQSTLGSL